jgi:hypothetical protein
LQPCLSAGAAGACASGLCGHCFSRRALLLTSPTHAAALAQQASGAARAQQLLDALLEQQAAAGWFRAAGADPPRQRLALLAVLANTVWTTHAAGPAGSAICYKRWWQQAAGATTAAGFKQLLGMLAQALHFDDEDEARRLVLALNSLMDGLMQNGGALAAVCSARLLCSAELQAALVEWLPGHDCSSAVLCLADGMFTALGIGGPAPASSAQQPIRWLADAAAADGHSLLLALLACCRNCIRCATLVSAPR